jgi:hypothetical protein
MLRGPDAEFALSGFRKLTDCNACHDINDSTAGIDSTSNVSGLIKKR